MKVVQMNHTCGQGSTGKICVAISKLLVEQDEANYIFFTRGESDYLRGIKFGNRVYMKLQALKSRVLGNYGFNSRILTKAMIAQLEKVAPNIVHLHNIHGHDCHLEMLFTYFRENKIKLYWTFHDCWAATAYCPYFDMVGCNKWKTVCVKCPQRRQFSWFFDRSRFLHTRKKRIFADLDLTIITPSQWLANIVKESFLQNYPVKVIHNGIDLDIFKPMDSDFRKRYHCEDKHILLGVAFDWGVRKGLDVFVDLARRLGNAYQIVLVGTNDKVDKQLPGNIISIHRTQNQKELAEIYTAADLFVNPTREENYPTVNMEAIACGTPVLTFCTGGSPEILDDTCGSVVPCDDVDAMEREIRRICREKPYTKEACLNRAKSFDMHERFGEYVQLYKSVTNE